jgi:16S rRNA (uracil1498-N3)-methyltransferase
MKHRFFCDALPNESDGERVVLKGAEAKHLTSVLRLGPGDLVELFDGRGSGARAEIIGGDKREIELSVIELEVDGLQRGPEVVLATAVPKGDRIRSLVEKATELGIDRLVPLKTRRSVVHPRAGKQKKMHQAVIAACKQCGRNRLMRIDPLMAWDELLAVENQSLVIGQRGAEDSGQAIDRLLSDPNTPLVLCVGPEGGWTDDELDAAREAKATLIGVGRHTLRIETAALALAALVSASRKVGD